MTKVKLVDLVAQVEALSARVAALEAEKPVVRGRTVRVERTEFSKPVVCRVCKEKHTLIADFKACSQKKS